MNIVFPFKVGDIYRAYCFGTCIDNYIRGIVIILFDRFIDTAALISLLPLLSFFAGTEMVGIVYFLLCFILGIIIVYFSWPGFCSFWKDFLLRRRSTIATLKAISLLDTCERIFCEIRMTARGRGIILYFLSLVAWTVEMLGVAVLAGVSEIGRQMGEYLVSVVRGDQTTPYRSIVVLSYVFLMAFYLVISMIKHKYRGK